MAGTKGHSGGHNRRTLEDHVIRGTFQAARHGGLTVPPVVVPGAVVKRSTLSAGAGRVWDDLAPLAIALGSLTVTDACCFGTLCELLATAELVVSDTTANGRRLYRQTALAALKYLELFGLAGPTSRKRISPRPADDSNRNSKWAGLLK